MGVRASWEGAVERKGGFCEGACPKEERSPPRPPTWLMDADPRGCSRSIQSNSSDRSVTPSSDRSTSAARSALMGGTCPWGGEGEFTGCGVGGPGGVREGGGGALPVHCPPTARLCTTLHPVPRNWPPIACHCQPLAPPSSPHIPPHLPVIAKTFAPTIARPPSPPPRLVLQHAELPADLLWHKVSARADELAGLVGLEEGGEGAEKSGVTPPLLGSALPPPAGRRTPSQPHAPAPTADRGPAPSHAARPPEAQGCPRRYQLPTGASPHVLPPAPHVPPNRPTSPTPPSFTNL